ncbi:phage baseplate upper protein [Bacillus paramobilis]|uniref:BppU family phage baseplate upper protein n=1 Tax=Bacillus paramobilis TaxID=2817477 RepID=UPI0030C9CEFD
MTFKTYEINVDLVNDISTTSAIRFSQNDRNSAKLLLTITNKGAELDLSQAKSVRMSFKKPDGTRIFQNDCQPINALKGKYQILLKTQTLTSIGNVIAQIHIEEEDRILDTQKFLFVVNESLAGDGAVESTNDFTIIKKALELGVKFKDVDFDPIIAAGELAKGALPKAGGTMTGTLLMQASLGFEGDRNIYRKLADGNFDKGFSLADANLRLNDWKNKRVVWEYDQENNKVNFMSDTNLLKKTGDTMTGDLTISRSNGDASAVNFGNGAGKNNYIYGGKDRLGAYSGEADQMVWRYIPSTRVFEIGADKVTMKKDGRATITVTADAELIGSYGVIADRRGNTVTLRAPIRRKVGSTSGHVFTLPADMRPTMLLTQVVHASDGTPALMTIPSDTGQVLIQTITPAITGKDYHIVLTYVVD